MKRLLKTSFVLAVLGACALIPGGAAAPTSASAQVYGSYDAGNVYRGGIYHGLGRSAYGVRRDLDYTPYNYNGGYGQGGYLPGYGRYSGRSGWGEYSKYRIPGTPR